MDLNIDLDKLSLEDIRALKFILARQQQYEVASFFRDLEKKKMNIEKDK